jgi:hypothetical protein
MRYKIAAGLVVGTAAIVTLARGGHELPIYPSFYPHEIEIKTLDPDRAGDALRSGDIQAYIGEALNFASAPAEQIRAIESLGSFVLVRVNPRSPLLTLETSPCAVVKAAIGELGELGGFILHPYPVTPFQGDYLYHADLAAAAKARFSQTAAAERPKLKASGSFGRIHPQWSRPEGDWDVEIMEADAAEQIAAAGFSVNGRLGPPWLRTGWFNAALLLADANDNGPDQEHAKQVRGRLESDQFSGLAERLDLERELVSTLARDCRKMVVGYTVKREYVNTEFSAGVENIGYDAMAGLASPIFIRTVKLKDFPWNGWLRLGIAAMPTSAWNPVAGMRGSFGQLMGFAVVDTALIPSPYETGWMLNRISDLPSELGR